MAGGLAAIAAASVWLAAAGATPGAALIATFGLMGGGLGIASVASTAMGTRAGDRPGLASGVLNTAAQLGTAIGLALLVAPAAAAGFAWGWAGAAAVALAAALAIGVRRPVAAARPCRSPG